MVNYVQVSSSRTLKNELPVYNPLSRTIQKTVTNVVDELAARYRSHESFEGLAIVCRPDTYTLLPGRQWGYDPATMRQFLQTQPRYRLGRDMRAAGSPPPQRPAQRWLLLGQPRS